MTRSPLRKKLVALEEVHFALLDFLVHRSPAVKQNALIRAAVQRFVLTHATWDSRAFSAFATEHYVDKAKLKGPAKKVFLAEVKALVASNASLGHSALPTPNTLDIASAAADFDL